MTSPSDPTFDANPAHQPHVVVIGSLNMDLLIRVPRAPDAGETVQGHALTQGAGGKGGNQAVSCARQGARVRMLACIGADAHGAALRSALDNDDIDTSGLQVSPSHATGVACVVVEDNGQNRIIHMPGANEALTLTDDQLRRELADVNAVVLQFETPMPLVERALHMAAHLGCRVILNPSPVKPLRPELWAHVDTLVVNETEAQALCRQAVQTPAQAVEAAIALRARGPQRVVVTLGGAGAIAADAQGCRHHPSRPVTVVDTTAAGDTFLGALATALARGDNFDEAVALGIRAAALAVGRPGAQPSIPTRDEVLASASALPAQDLTASPCAQRV